MSSGDIVVVTRAANSWGRSSLPGLAGKRAVSFFSGRTANLPSSECHSVIGFQLGSVVCVQKRHGIVTGGSRIAAESLRLLRPCGNNLDGSFGSYGGRRSGGIDFAENVHVFAAAGVLALR